MNCSVYSIAIWKTREWTKRATGMYNFPSIGGAGKWSNCQWITAMQLDWQYLICDGHSSVTAAPILTRREKKEGEGEASQKNKEKKRNTYKIFQFRSWYEAVSEASSTIRYSYQDSFGRLLNVTTVFSKRYESSTAVPALRVKRFFPDSFGLLNRKRRRRRHFWGSWRLLKIVSRFCLKTSEAVESRS